jgi:hypothetical protein
MRPARPVEEPFYESGQTCEYERGSQKSLVLELLRAIIITPCNRNERAGDK